ncbi:Diaminopimelate epimerase-like protein [Aspergillus sclerotioniger CBS 115572]|uniref:trans-L-3-hydroxyproline dehydratase n=1 Tax=Aspergillus sclerotioniger CBS 115572 TaxID=1450535 RepID=A0A317V2S3_9EURO|nr:Diaminopimelate epimerase-like protein [Aspergillus sclerotioniger CBS 115572]PWY66490.1 Diaminopimelate epimerase-like protein [Aspergillus sclerotioniger CBS 115572]
MDVARSLELTTGEVIKCIDMHTTGEPTRIVYAGFPTLTGKTLFAQRDQARDEYDHIRKRIMLEPRGHYDMYGAILTQSTELVESGQAHIGVLFTHNGGFSTMCGHATIALGRFLVDTRDLTVFPKRNELVLDTASQAVAVNLHAPCGLVHVTVPVTSTAEGFKSDPSRAVSFVSTPAYAAATNLTIPIPPELRWNELGTRDSITLDVSYGGAFYALVSVEEVGFNNRGLAKIDLDNIIPVLGQLQKYLTTHPDIVAACQHPEDKRLSFLYSVMVVDPDVGDTPEGVDGAETGLCFFADSEIDRSPTGSCVVARMALAYAKGERRIGQRWAYHSVVSNHFKMGAFVGEIVETGGSAFYIGTSSFVVEEGDVTGHSGFMLKSVTQ